MLKPEHIRALRQNGFPPEMVLKGFEATTIQRGVYYFENRRVIESSNDVPSLSLIQLEASVLGEQKYTTRVNIDLSSYQIRSRCSCPVYKQCKHAVAAVLDYVVGENPAGISMPGSSAVKEPKKPSAVELWLAELNTDSKKLTQAVVQANPDNARVDLIYLLSQKDKNSNQLDVEPRRATRLKRGGYGQGYRVQLSDLLHQWKDPGFNCTPEDRDISHLLMPHRHNNLYTPESKTYSITGGIGRLALQMMLATGRAFWQKTDYPALQDSAPRTLEFAWESTADEKSRQIQPLASIAIHDYFWMDQLYFVDVLRSEIGELQHAPLLPQQVVNLLKAPPIPHEEAKKVSEKLLDILPNAEIPLPAREMNPEAIDVHVEQLIPVLELRAAAKTDNPELADMLPEQHIASLSFDYAGHEIQPDHQQGLSLLRRDNFRYRIHRKPELEQQAIDRLVQCGFSQPKPNSRFKPLELILDADSPMLVALRWNNFLDHTLPELEEAGWRITRDDSFTMEFTLVDDWEAELEQQGQEWFDISLGFVIEGKRINLLPILVDMLAQMKDPKELHTLLAAQEHMLIPLDDKRWVKLESGRLSNVLNTLIELYDNDPLDHSGQLRLNKFQGAQLAELLNDPKLHWKGADELKNLANKLHNFQGVETVEPPRGLLADLRPYQQDGLNWLQFLREFNFNGVLADDMGLGKTIQALSHMLLEKQSGRSTLPNLVIAPTSLMSNWRRETEKFTPELSVLVLHGSERKQHFAQINDYDLVLTTYPLILRDEEVYRDLAFNYLILDEAQYIKNAKSKTTQVIYELKTQHRLCLTGTPMENHLGELWSMFHFLMPGYLGPQDRFSRLFRTPIEKQGDHERQKRLRSRVAPFMLRRSKELVASELPPKTEIIRTVTLEGAQRDLYESVRLAMDKKVRDEIRDKGFARSQIMILDALLKLRQVCCDPRIMKLERAKSVTESAKLDMLLSMLDEMLGEGRKVLLFSQFTSMLALIEQAFIERGFRYSLLTGQTKDRETAITNFQEGDAQVFLISLKAGGTGLNLTAADTVIHYDPWWNPAVEQQATDRAYRIGQDKPVFVYKLLTEDTVEEKILKLQEKKQSLADGLYSDKQQQKANFTQDDLMDLLRPLDN
ncbi:MAG: SNF2-related protein [Thiolinea sp.]